MPLPLEYIDMYEQAVYWEIVSSDGEGLPIVTATPVQLRCRWEETNREMMDPNGQKINVDVSMATDRNLKIGSMIWEGSLEDLEDAVGTSLTPEADIYEVIMRDRGKDLLGTVTRYEFGLKRFRDSMPKMV